MSHISNVLTLSNVLLILRIRIVRKVSTCITEQNNTKTVKFTYDLV